MSTWADPKLVNDARIADGDPLVRHVAERLHANESLHLHIDVADVVCVYCALRASQAIRWAEEWTQVIEMLKARAREIDAETDPAWPVRPGIEIPEGVPYVPAQPCQCSPNVLQMYGGCGVACAAMAPNDDDSGAPNGA